MPGIYEDTANNLTKRPSLAKPGVKPVNPVEPIDVGPIDRPDSLPGDNPGGINPGKQGVNTSEHDQFGTKEPGAKYSHGWWDETFDTEGARQDLAGLKADQTEQGAQAINEALAAQGGNAAAAGGMTTGLYNQASRDLAVEQEMLRRRQLGEMGRVAGLLMKDRWKELDQRHQFEMADIMLENKKQLAVILQKRADGLLDDQMVFELINALGQGLYNIGTTYGGGGGSGSGFAGGG